VVSVATPAGVCLEIFKSTSDGPVLRSAIAPDGAVYRKPEGLRIEINPTIAGWYTVQLDTPPPGQEQVFEFVFGLDSVTNCLSTPPR
jgi:hypothetical protein